MTYQFGYLSDGSIISTSADTGSIFTINPKLRHDPKVHRQLEYRAANQLHRSVDADVIHELIEVAPGPHRNQKERKPMCTLLLVIQQQLWQSEHRLDQAGKNAEKDHVAPALLAHVSEDAEDGGHHEEGEEVGTVVTPVPEALDELVCLYLVRAVEGVYFDYGVVFDEVHDLVTLIFNGLD